MRQIGDPLGFEIYGAGATGGPADDAAFAFCLGEITIGLRLRNGEAVRGILKGFSCLDLRREEGSLLLHCPSSHPTRYSFRDIAMIDLPNHW